MDIKPNSVIHLEPGDTLPGHTNLKPVPDKYLDELKALINNSILNQVIFTSS